MLARHASANGRIPVYTVPDSFYQYVSAPRRVVIAQNSCEIKTRLPDVSHAERVSQVLTRVSISQFPPANSEAVGRRSGPHGTDFYSE